MKLIPIVLICTIIAFAFGSENAEKHRPSGKAGRFQHRKHGKMAYRNIIPEGLELYLNETSGLIGFLNTTTNVAAIFDISSGISAIFNGQGGNAIVIDSNSLTLSRSDNVWTATNVHFEEFFRSLPNLQCVSRSGQVTKQEVEPELTRLAVQLGIESNAYENLVGASKVLKQIEKTLKMLMKTDHFRVRGGLLRTVSVLKGIVELLDGNSQELLNQLKKSGGFLDFAAIINAPNGLQALLRVFQSLGPINMSPIMGNPLNNLEKMLGIIVDLGGNDSDNGVDNALRIIKNIVAIINGHGCLDCLIQALLEAGQNGGVEVNPSDITPIIDDLLKLGENQNGGMFNGLIRFLRDLNSNNLFMNDINISRLLLLLRKGDYKDAIDMIVRFFVHFNNLLNPTQSIPRFFGYLLSVFNSTRGARFFPQFLPGVDPDQARRQLQSVNISDVFQNRTDFSNLRNVPVLGALFDLFNSSVERASNGGLNFQNLLSQNGGAGFFPASFGRFFGFGIFQPLQSFVNANPLQSFVQNLGDGGIPIVGQLSPPNIANFLVDSSAASSSTTEVLPSNYTTPENPEETFFRRKGHGRKGSWVHHANAKHHREHLKHHTHERNHRERSHERS